MSNKKVGSKAFKKLSIFIGVFVLLSTVFFIYKAKDLQFNYEFEEFFPAEDEEADYFYNYRKQFSTDNDFILISVENNKGVFDQKFLTEFKRFSQEIGALDLVDSRRDLSTEEELFIYTNGNTSQRPYIHFDYSQLKQDSINIFENKELINTLIDRNAQALAIIVQHQSYLSKEKSDRINSELNAIVDNYSFDKVRLSGRVIGQKFYIDTMEVEMKFFLAISMVLVVIFLLLAFKSIWGLILPLVVIVLSLIWTLGILSWLNEPVNILLTVLPSIMFVVGMSDVIHFVTKYVELLREGLPKFEAIKISFKEVGMATFLTSLTTAIGFFSLFMVNVKPVQKFGLATGIAVFVAFVLTFSILPILFYYTKKPKIAQKKEGGHFWKKNLHRSLLFTLKNRKTIIWTTLVFMLVATYGSFQLNQDNFLMDDIKSSSPLKQNFNYLDTAFGGVRPFELAIEAKESGFNFFQKDALTEISQVENYLRSKYGVTVKASLPFFVSLANRASRAGDTNFFKLPDSQKRLNKIRRQFKIANNETGLLDMLVDSSSRITRISGTLPDIGNVAVTKKNKDLYAYIQKEFPNSPFSYKLASTAHILDKNMSYLSGSLVKGLLLATLIVALIMGVLYKDFKIVFISILPNVIPLILIAAVMGYCGINLKITTAIIFTIAFGIAVDDTIHFMSKFKLELNKGKGKLYALKRSYLSTGRAIVLTSLILCSGFLLLVFSEFLGTVYMGLMISITLFSAVIADLYLLPLLLLYFYSPKARHKKE